MASVDWLEVLKIAVPAAGAWMAAYLANRKERREWTAKREAQQQKVLDSQADKLSAGWVEMTSQAREIINRLQMETIDAKTRSKVAEEKVIELARDFSLAEEKIEGLEREIAEVRGKYETAQREIAILKERRPRTKP